MVHLEEREAPPAKAGPPRLAWTLALLLGLLILAHGCHGPDEDHELFAPRIAPRMSLHPIPAGARAAHADEGGAAASAARAPNGSPPANEQATDEQAADSHRPRD